MSEEIEAIDGIAVLREEVSEGQQFLTFTVQEETYGVDLLSVREIIEYGHVTKVPGSPCFIEGIMNLRGAVIPVLDMLALFENQKNNVGKKTCIVMLEAKIGDSQQVMGLMVDAVSEVVDILDKNIEPAPAFGSNIKSEYVSGIGKHNDDFVVLLNVRNMLTDGWRRSEENKV